MFKERLGRRLRGQSVELSSRGAGKNFPQGGDEYLQGKREKKRSMESMPFPDKIVFLFKRRKRGEQKVPGGKTRMIGGRQGEVRKRPYLIRLTKENRPIDDRSDKAKKHKKGNKKGTAVGAEKINGGTGKGGVKMFYTKTQGLFRLGAKKTRKGEKVSLTAATVKEKSKKNIEFRVGRVGRKKSLLQVNVFKKTASILDRTQAENAIRRVNRTQKNTGLWSLFVSGIRQG